MRTDIDIHKFKTRLQEEEANLVADLQKIGHVNPQNPTDWEANVSDINQNETDPVDRADNIEEHEADTAIVGNLETRLNNVRRALDKIEKGTYGYCEISNEPIEIDRLEANPSARTCKAHLSEAL